MPFEHRHRHLSVQRAALCIRNIYNPHASHSSTSTGGRLFSMNFNISGAFKPERGGGCTEIAKLKKPWCEAHRRYMKERQRGTSLRCRVPPPTIFVTCSTLDDETRKKLCVTIRACHGATSCTCTPVACVRSGSQSADSTGREIRACVLPKMGCPGTSWLPCGGRTLLPSFAHRVRRGTRANADPAA